MAIIRKMEKIELERDTRHTEVDCTYSIILNPDGKKYLQIDTYGSTNRKISGKKSQSIRFAPEALKQLRMIIEDFN